MHYKQEKHKLSAADEAALFVSGLRKQRDRLLVPSCGLDLGTLHGACSGNSTSAPWWWDPHSQQKPEATPLRLNILTMVKDAQSLLREWVPYHLLLGAAHIYIVNNDCDGDLRTYSGCATLQPYIQAGAVTFIDTEFKCRRVTRGPLLSALSLELLHQSMAEKFPTEQEWVLEIDPDEYVVLPPGVRLSGFLNAMVRKQQHLDSIPLPWRIFGTSFRANHTNEGSLIANYRLRLPLALSLETMVRLVESQKARDQINPFLNKEMVRLSGLGDKSRCEEPAAAHSYRCTRTFDWSARRSMDFSSRGGDNVDTYLNFRELKSSVGSNVSSFINMLDQTLLTALSAPVLSERPSPYPAAAADAFIHHYTFLSEEEWERKKLRGRPRKSKVFARRKGGVDPLFSAVYDTTILERIKKLAASARQWSSDPEAVRRCASFLQIADRYFDGAIEYSRPREEANAVLARARREHARLSTERSAHWLLEQQWAQGSIKSRAPIIAAHALGADNNGMLTSHGASRWLLAHWNESGRIRSIASSVIGRIISAYPRECAGKKYDGQSSCAGWSTLENERV